MPCDYSTERELLSQNYNYICGIDEVGRGALFGPVVAGAVILDPQKPINGINDSKQVRPSKRQNLSQQIYADSMAYSIGWCWNDEIDDINILQATKKAIKMALRGLQIKPDYVLIDGMKADFVEIDGRGIIKGDTISVSIAAASIIAKVFRDHLICSFAPFFPEYSLDSHKGYGTRKHIDALNKNGFTQFHRKSFKIRKPMTRTPGEK